MAPFPKNSQLVKLGALALQRMAPPLPVGELHPDPVETRFGFHVIRMDEKAEGAQLPFDAVESSIRENLEQVAWAKAANVLTKKLVNQAVIEGIDIG